MSKQNKNDNAANRKSYVGAIYNIGEKQVKDAVLHSIKPEWAALHNDGYIHIHDLDAYGLTYNCLTFDILKAFPYKQFSGLSETEIIVGVFDFLKELLAKMGNEQSGGMAFANFDNDFAEIFKNLGITYTTNKELFRATIRSFILWCNNIHCFFEENYSFFQKKYDICPNYIFVDISTVSDTKFYTTKIKELLKTNIIGEYSFRQTQRDMGNLNLSLIIPADLYISSVPIIFLTDVYSSLTDNALWMALRANENDIVIDRHTNIELLSKLLKNRK